MMIYAKHIVHVGIAVLAIATYAYVSQSAIASGSQVYSTPGTYQFTVPTFATLSVTVDGAGGGGGGRGNTPWQYGTAGSSGSSSQFNAMLLAGGGGGGEGGDYNGTAGANGSLGTASGGDTNTAGGGSAGGVYGSGVWPPWGDVGGNGGAGGRVVKTYSSGQLTVGSSITVIVGAGGAGGQDGNGTFSAGIGGNGSVAISWTEPVSAPSCTLSPSSQTISLGSAAALNYTITGSATNASINSASVPTSSSGSYSPSPTETTSYTMTVTNAGGSNNCGPATVTVSQTPTQGEGDAITGYAWSDTIGWIDLNCSNSNTCNVSDFGLAIDTNNGKLSGYAWSDNVGWIDANEDDLSGCPQTPCRAKLNGNDLSGWLKALSGGSSESGGWDGWISLSGSGPDYGVVKQGDGTFTGYAWGSTVVGWIDFSYAQTGYQVCTPATTWSCSDASTIASTTVTAQCQTSVTPTTCVSPYFCSAGSSVCLSPLPSFVSFTDGDGNSQDGHLSVRPQIVPTGLPVKAYWNVDNVASCAVQGTNGQNWTGSASSPGGQSTANINGQTTFTLTCQSIADGSEVVNESKTVNVVPIFQEN